MKTKYKALLAMCVCVSVTFCAAFAAYGYFTDNRDKDNSVKAGNNVIGVDEDYIPPSEQTPGNNDYKKEINVENNGNVPCYIRVYADFSDSSVRERSYFSNDGSSFYSAKRDLTDSSTYVSNLSQGGKAALNWVFIPDDAGNDLSGYYYYTLPVAPGESTATPLFTYVRTSNASIDEIKQYDIIVYSESYQTTDSNGEYYSDYAAAWTDYLGRS